MSKRDVVLRMYAVNIHAHHMRYWVLWLGKPWTLTTTWAMLSLESQSRYLDLASCVQDALEKCPGDQAAAADKVMDYLEELEWLDPVRPGRKALATPGDILINWATHPLGEA